MRFLVAGVAGLVRGRVGPSLGEGEDVGGEVWVCVVGVEEARMSLMRFGGGIAIHGVV